MKKYLYFTLIPEALIASMLPPEAFGNYLAVGSQKRTRGQAIFFEIDPAYENDRFPAEYLDERCVPRSDGTPKSSVYLSIYRVLEHIPLEAFRKMYLVTDNGKVLELEKGACPEEKQDELHLYQELCPVRPRIASRLEPSAFMKFVTDMSQPISVPRLVVAELILEGLATDPENGSFANLPYHDIHHLRDCLVDLKNEPKKPTKTVVRSVHEDIPFRTLKEGFFVGDKGGMIFYPFPSIEELESKYYAWWKSALRAR
jgi:hypothetical protein